MVRAAGSDVAARALVRSKRPALPAAVGVPCPRCASTSSKTPVPTSDRRRRKPVFTNYADGWGLRFQPRALLFNLRGALRLRQPTEDEYRGARHVQPLDVDRSDPLSLSPPSADVYDQMSEQASKTLEDEPRFLGTTGAGRRTLNWSALWRRPQMRLTGLLQQTNAFGLLYYGNQAPSLRARRLKTERAIAAAQKDEEAGEAIQSTLEDMALSRLGLPLHGADTPRTTQSGRETVTSRQHPRRGEISQTPIKDIQLYERGVQLRPTGVPAWQGVHPRSMAQRTERNPNLAFDEDNTNPTLHRAWTGNFPISHRKLQKLADLIRGLPIEMAILQMKFSHKAAAHPVLAMLEKARGEALARGFKHEQLAVDESWVGKGIYSRRTVVKGRGRAGIMHHPEAAMYVVLRHQRSRVEQRELDARKAMDKRLRKRGVPPGAARQVPAQGHISIAERHKPMWTW